MANSHRSAVFILQLLLLAGPTWAQSPSNTAAPSVASFPVDPAPEAVPPAAPPPLSPSLPAPPPPPLDARSSSTPEAPLPPPPSAVAPVDAKPAEPVRSEPRYDDYRPQLILSDSLALGLAVSAGVWQGASSHLALASLGVYALGAPVIHIAHGQPARSLASLGARVGLPFVGAFAGILSAAPFCAGTSEDCLTLVAVFGALGFVGGGVAALIIDDGFLGKVKLDEPASEPALRGGHSIRAALVPLVDPHRKTFGASLVGSF